MKLNDLLRTAGYFYEGDYPDGKNIPDSQEQTLARETLSGLFVSTFGSFRFIDDEVTEVFMRNLVVSEIHFLTIGEVKDILLGENGVSWIEKYRDGLYPEVVSALVKIMTSEELSKIAHKVFNPLEGAVGSSIHFGSRIQPNSAGDNEDEILFSILDALCLGCGDVMIGLNPACDDVPTVMRLLDLLADVVDGLEIPTRFCVLSDIVKLTKARRAGARVDLGFQSLAGTSSALLGMIGVDAKEIIEMSKGFNGLYFEIGMGLEVSNGNDEGVDMRTLTCRAAGLTRMIQKITGKWTVVNTVTNFIGPEIFRTEEQLYRAGLEDVVMMKLLGLTGGIDVCAPFHMGIHPNRLCEITESLVKDAHPAFIMSIQSGIDKMLGYETTSTRMYFPLLQKNDWNMTKPMDDWLTALHFFDTLGVGVDTSEMVPFLYLKYQKSCGDTRGYADIYLEALKKIRDMQDQGFDIGYTNSRKTLLPQSVEKKVEQIYRNAEKSFYSQVDMSIARDISPKYFEVETLCKNFDEYLRNPRLGTRLKERDEHLIKKMYSSFLPDVQFVFSDGLNANALNENLRHLVPAIRHGLIWAGVQVGDSDIYVKYGRVRVGYTIGTILNVPLIVHFIGERAGTGLDMLSAYITYGKNRFQTDMNHSLTTAVCGIHKQGKHPDLAVTEIIHLIKLMFERKCSGIELVNSE